jgi:hypothetical protein
VHLLHIFTFCILGLFFYSCNDTSSKLDSSSKLSADVDTLVLLFQKEHRGEVWFSGKPSILLYTFKWEGRYPLGYLSSFNGGDLPEQYQGKRSYIFPYNPGSQGLSGTCFACRHDKVQAYATLDLIIKELRRNID